MARTFGLNFLRLWLSLCLTEAVSPRPPPPMKLHIRCRRHTIYLTQLGSTGKQKTTLRISNEGLAVGLPDCHVSITKYHGLSGLNNRHFSFHGSGPQNSQFKVSSGLVPFEAHEGKFFPGLSPGFWWCWKMLVFHGLWTHHPNLCLHEVLCACLGPHFPFLRTPVILD